VDTSTKRERAVVGAAVLLCALLVPIAMAGASGGSAVEVIAFQTTGGDLDVDSSPGESSPDFSMTWVAPGP
jgi:hypothetical protein